MWFAWVRIDVYARGKAKTGQKEYKMVEQGMVLCCMHKVKKCIMLAGMVEVLRELKGEQSRENKGRAAEFNVFRQRKSKKTNRETKLNSKTRTHKYDTTCNPRPQIACKNDDTKLAKKKQKKSTTPQNELFCSI